LYPLLLSSIGAAGQPQRHSTDGARHFYIGHHRTVGGAIIAIGVIFAGMEGLSQQAQM